MWLSYSLHAFLLLWLLLQLRAEEEKQRLEAMKQHEQAELEEAERRSRGRKSRNRRRRDADDETGRQRFINSIIAHCTSSYFIVPTLIVMLASFLFWLLRSHTV
jgi:hypothetical protein